MNTNLLSQILTFASGVCAAGATYAMTDPGAMPKWLGIAFIICTGGFAKASIGALPMTVSKPAPKEDK